MILRGFAIGTPSGDRTLDTLRTLGVCIPSYHFISYVISSPMIVENSTDSGYHNTKWNLKIFYDYYSKTERFVGRIYRYEEETAMISYKKCEG